MDSSIFLHALDLYHSKWAHEEFSQPKREIERAAHEYLRIALCLADVCILPASSFFESEMTRKLLRRHPEFVRYRRVLLSATEGSIAEHVEKKLNMYQENSPEELIRAYKGRYKTVFPGYIQKAGSSTKKITESWLEYSDDTDIRKVLDPNEILSLPSNFEQSYRQLPLSLDGRAFVTSHAKQVLQVQTGSKLDEFKLAPIIQPAYANSYVETLGADILINVPILNVGYEDRLLGRKRIDMAAIVAQLMDANLFRYLIESTSKRLFSVLHSPAWEGVRNAILKGKLAHELEQIEPVISALRDRSDTVKTRKSQFQSLLPGVEKFLAKEEQPIPLLFALTPTNKDDLKTWRSWLQKMPSAFSGTTLTLRVYCAASGCCTFKNDFTPSPGWLRMASPLLRLASLGLAGLAIPATGEAAGELGEAANFMGQLSQIDNVQTEISTKKGEKHFSPGDINLLQELYVQTGFAPGYAGMELMKFEGRWGWVSSDYSKSRMKVI